MSENITPTKNPIFCLPQEGHSQEDILNKLIEMQKNDIDWEGVWTVLNVYDQSVNAAFVSVNVNGHLEVQLVPFVEYTLMNSERFPSFVSSATSMVISPSIP